MRALRTLCAALALASAAAAQQVGELLVIQETGPRDKRVNMVIIGDGYTAAEKSKFIEHAKLFSKGVVEDPPLTGYAKYFNVYAIFVASNQSGADIPTQGISRDTYFNANYDAALGRLLVIDFTKGFSVIDKWVPERDIPVAIVNSTLYGGSGGPIAVANHTAPEIIAHEVQHSFTGLGDEYDYAGVEAWEAPNTTQRTARAQIPWTHWIAASTPVPTPETSAWLNVPGLFEGAAYHATGWYRPAQNCRMKENDRPFCAVCSEAILLQIYDRVSPMDSSLPIAKTVNAGTSPAVLRVVTKQPTTHAIKVEWAVNGVVDPSVTGTSFNKALDLGRHKVTARISDPTPMVKQDANRVLRDSAAWEVVVTNVSGLAGRGNGDVSLGFSGVSGGRLAFRLPEDGAYALAAFAADGRRLGRWRMTGGRRGENTLDLRALPRSGGNASLKGLVLFRLEQDGARALSRPILSD